MPSSAAWQQRGQIVSVKSYEFSQNGIVAAVPGIAAEVNATGAQALFMTADTAGALPLVTQLLRDNGVSPPTTAFLGLTRWDIPAATLSLPGVQGAGSPCRTRGFMASSKAATRPPSGNSRCRFPAWPMMASPPLARC